MGWVHSIEYSELSKTHAHAHARQAMPHTPVVVTLIPSKAPLVMLYAK